MSAAAKTSTPAPASVGQVTVPTGDGVNGKTYPVFDSTLRIYESGSLVDQKTNKVKFFDGGIKIKTPAMEKAAKISARALVEIYWLMGNDEQLKTFVRARIAEEKTHETDF